MSWPQKTYNGIVYTFNHLVPFTFVANGRRVRVTFGAHAFTREQQPTDPAHMIFMDGKTARVFCPTRYAHSMHLPQVIMNAANGMVFKKPKAFVFKGSLPGIKGFYIIAFQMRRSNSPKYDIKVQLLSAHHSGKAAHMPKAKFWDVMECLINTTPVAWIKK